MDTIIDLALHRIDWVAITGIFALLFTATALFIQRKHNRLSVKPIAIITVADYEERISVYLQNKGNGPLIIKEVYFIDENNSRKNVLIHFFGSDFADVLWETFASDINGWAILPGEQNTLLELTGDPNNIDFITKRNRVRNVLSSIEVFLHYQDIYGKDMPVKSRKLDYFSRKN